MEKYIPRQKGKFIKLIIFLIIIAGIVILFHKNIIKIFSSDNNQIQNQNDDQENIVERRLKSVEDYDIKTYPPEKIQVIRLADWVNIIQTRMKINHFTNPQNLVFINYIYDIEPRWCYVVGDVLITKSDNKLILVLNLRRPDVVEFKFKDINQIYRATLPTLNDVKVSAKFYGMTNVKNPSVFNYSKNLTFLSDSQKPSERIEIELIEEKIKGFKFVIIEIKGKKYFVFA